MYTDLLARSGGIVRASVLFDRGLSRYFIANELTAGRLVRVRKGWLALPNADRQLIAAATHGLTITCVTQAERLGLWVRAAASPHFAVPRPGAEHRPGVGETLHYGKPLTPRPRFALTDSLENVLVLVARCQPFEDAVATWDSALNRRLVDSAALGRLQLSTAARSVLEATSPFADSGLESYLRVRLRWLRLSLHAQAWVCGHRVDFLLGERLVIQIDGAHHVGTQRTRDISHDAELNLRGYTVIRLTYSQIMASWPEAQSVIMRAVARGLHRASHAPRGSPRAPGASGTSGSSGLSGSSGAPGARASGAGEPRAAS